jgi:hypothetical protein
MSAQVKIIADSISVGGKRITTFQLRYWRAIHSEVMTHRVFARNASSSRAIPVSKIIKQVMTDPAGPIFWGSNKPGMQAGEELMGLRKAAAQFLWRTAGKVACVFAWGAMKLGLHKQVANRLLEPWQYISVVVTATEYENFFELRCHPAAQPEIQELATMMHSALTESMPQTLEPGQWHLPYVTSEDLYELSRTRTPDEAIAVALKMSTARCARVSFLTHESTKPTIEDDIALYGRLVGSAPIHASPCEHQASPDDTCWIETSLIENDKEELLSSDKGAWVHPELHGNLKGWVQHRKFIERGMCAADYE